MRDVMIDIETLGVRPTSAIVQIGACYFDRKTGEIGERLSINIKPPEDDRFTTDKSTLDWWDSQSQAARAAVFTATAVSIEGALVELTNFLRKAEYLWCHATFDAPIVFNAFTVCGIKIPMHYRSTRDIRTLMDIADHHSGRPRGGIHHNAIDDCVFQVGYVVEAFNKIKHATSRI